MAWVKGDDVAPTTEVVNACLVEGDDRLKLELFGFVYACACSSAKERTDYRVPFAFAALHSPTRAVVLLEKAVTYGYMDVVDATTWKIREIPGLFHIRTKAELEWEAQQSADASNGTLTMQVRFRDGDACRYCRVVVNWADHTGPRGGTYDHVHPGEPARSSDDLRVACRACNGGRRDRPNADEAYPPLPTPAHPFYTEKTAAMLREAGFKGVRKSGESRRPERIQPRPKSTERPATQAEDATLNPATPNPSGQRESTSKSPAVRDETGEQTGTEERPATQAEDAISSTEPVSTAGAGPPRPGNLGSPGREGKGLAGSGRDGAAGQPPGSAGLKPAPKRSRRGKGHGVNRGASEGGSHG